MKAVLGRREPLEVYGTDYQTPDGTAIRDYVQVVDLADAHLKALEYLEGGGATAVLNLGTGVGSSVFEVLAAAERVIGRPVPHELVARRPGIPWPSTPIPRVRRRSWTGTAERCFEESWHRRGSGTRLTWTGTPTEKDLGRNW
jgi:UDP-glucose 4-epimerase